MQLGILGLPKVGKTTLFNTLTASHQETDKFASSRKTHLAIAKVPDPRLQRLRDLFQPKRYVQATVEYVDIPGVKKGEGSESLDLAQLRTVDALVHVVRDFEDPEIPHPGGVDPAGDIATLDLELVLADHDIVSRRLDRLDKSAKRGLETEEKREQHLLSEIILPCLEEERPLRHLTLAPEEEKRLRGFQLLSAKPILIVLNVTETRIAENPARELLQAAGSSASILVVSAPIEEEISRLGPEEQREFLADLELTEPSLDRVLRASYELLGLISFFTVGEDEVRAWTLRRGSSAR